MPWKKGESGNFAGRKGNVFERRQLTKMQELLNTYLEVAERILGDKGNVQAKKRDERKIELLSADMRKILDKLHASKQETETTVRLPQNLLALLMYAQSSTGRVIELVDDSEGESYPLLGASPQDETVGERKPDSGGG